VQPQCIDEMVELLGQTADRQLSAFDVFALGPQLLPEPVKSAKNKLQRLPQIMSCHREQHRIEVARTLQVVLATWHDTDLSEFNHDAPLLSNASASFDYSRVDALTAVRFRCNSG
jgi:hypothetical protein